MLQFLTVTAALFQIAGATSALTLTRENKGNGVYTVTRAGSCAQTTDVVSTGTKLVDTLANQDGQLIKTSFAPSKAADSSFRGQPVCEYSCENASSPVILAIAGGPVKFTIVCVGFPKS